MYPLVARSISGVCGTLCSLPFEWLQIYTETGRVPSLNLYSELMFCAMSGFGFPIHATLRKILPPVLGGFAAACFLPPPSIVLQLKKGVSRYSTTYVNIPVFSVMVFVHELILHCLMARGTVLATISAYPAKLVHST